MADDLGGDDRLVAFMQYLRVLVVVLLTPLLVAAFGGGGAIGPAPRRGPLGDPRDWLLTRADRARSRRSPPAARDVPAGHAARARWSWPAR